MFSKPTELLGVGVNFRSEIAPELLRHYHHLDFIEINTERFFVSNPKKALLDLIDRLPVVLHGLSLSLGTEETEISSAYLKSLTTTLKQVDCRWFSEHMAATQVRGHEIRSLLPLAFTEEAVARLVNKIKCLKVLSPKPFLLENISYYFAMPQSRLSEAEFITQILTKADCGLLLDLNNLYVNAINHRYDPQAFLKKIPLERVVEVHLAGCDYLYGLLVDTHASSIRREVLNLLEDICQRTQIAGVIIERDAKLNKFTDLLEEVEVVRDILKKHYGRRFAHAH